MHSEPDQTDIEQKGLLDGCANSKARTSSYVCSRLTRTDATQFSQRKNRLAALACINILITIFNLFFLFCNISSLNLPQFSSADGFDTLYSPAREAIKYETRTFNTSLYVSNKYNGEVNDEQIQAWYELVQPDNIVISAQQLRKLNRTSIELPGQGYLVGLGVTHHLHCLNYLRMNIYNDIYNIGEDPHTIKIHISHCIDSLRTYLQCQGDISILTYSWRPDYLNPWLDFQVEHRCRSFDAIRQWAIDNQPNMTGRPFKNPIFKWDKYDPHQSIPTKFENSTELVGGTRENQRALKLAGGAPY